MMQSSVCKGIGHPGKRQSSRSHRAIFSARRICEHLFAVEGWHPEFIMSSHQQT
jgi:hypothetical protein